jgi:hypothetical protein
VKLDRPRQANPGRGAQADSRIGNFVLVADWLTNESEGCFCPNLVKEMKALVNPEGDPVKSGPGFHEDELVLESLVYFFGGGLVSKKGTFVHKENFFVAYRDIVNEKLKE